MGLSLVSKNETMEAYLNAQLEQVKSALNDLKLSGRHKDRRIQMSFQRLRDSDDCTIQPRDMQLARFLER